MISFTPEICGNILNIFGVGLKPQKFLYKIKCDKLIYIVLLEIVLCGRLCLVLVISDIGFKEDKSHTMLSMFNGGDGIYHYHYIFGI